jgi:hypothetical protein
MLRSINNLEYLLHVSYKYFSFFLRHNGFMEIMKLKLESFKHKYERMLSAQNCFMEPVMCTCTFRSRNISYCNALVEIVVIAAPIV